MARVFIKTFGCSLNVADSEAMGGILSNADHRIVSNECDSEVVVINSCVVKGHSQAQLFTYLDRMQSLGKKIVVAGCGAQAMPEQLKGVSLIGTHQVGRIHDAVGAALSGQTLVSLEVESKQRVQLPKIRRNPVIDIIPINKGCLGACTFCIVKKTRGTLESYSPRDIIDCIESGISQGVKEVWLTSPDTAVYGVDARFPLPRLLRRICDIEGDFQVRLGMGNPNWFIRYVEELPEVFSHPKMFQFLHVPVQSGNDKVLADMKRGYRAKDYEKIVHTMRSAIPDMTISTDVIVGFPGESNEEFLDTVRCIQETKPDVLNLSRFTARPGTPAEIMPNQVPGKIRKDRSTLLAQVHKQIAAERNRQWIGWKGRVLIDENGAPGSMISRNFAYKPVVVPCFVANPCSMDLGSIIDVQVTEVFPHFLKAVPILKINPELLWRQ